MGSQSLIYFDSMVFIYYLDPQDSTLHEASKLLLERMFTGQIDVITSNISVIETLSPAQFVNDRHRVVEYTLFFQNTTHLTVLPIEWKVSLKAAELRRQNKTLRTPDAIHLATAIIHESDTFITNDDRLSRLKLPLKITPLIKYHEY